MGWPSKGTALPGITTIANVVDLTGQTDLANLEVDGELSIADLLVTASDTIRRQLVGDGIDPSLLTNEDDYKDAVAWHMLARLVIRGLLPVPDGQEYPRNTEGQADPYAWSDVYYKRIRPELSSGDEPGRSGRSIPRVANVNRYPRFGSRDFYDDLNRRR